MHPVFPTLDEVLAVHGDPIQTCGGSPGIRDRGLLFRAGNTFGDLRRRPSSPESVRDAAGYLFHIVQNHPFVDGNERTALASSLVFLLLNEVGIQSSEDDLTELVLGVTEGKTSKSEVAVFLQRHAEGK